jgi:hypothetical protein
MKPPDAKRARVLRDAILRARRVHAHVLANLEPPTYPRGWSADEDRAWVTYDAFVRRYAQLHAPMNVWASMAYWRTLALMFRGEVLDREFDTYAQQIIDWRAGRQDARSRREVRRGGR